jgi:hypothetical protein
MPLILFFGKELQTRSRCFVIPETVSTSGWSLNRLRKISEKDSELENLLGTAVWLRNSQIRTPRSQAEGSKGNSKAR